MCMEWLNNCSSGLIPYLVIAQGIGKLCNRILFPALHRYNLPRRCHWLQVDPSLLADYPTWRQERPDRGKCGLKSFEPSMHGDMKLECIMATVLEVNQYMAFHFFLVGANNNYIYNTKLEAYRHQWNIWIWKSCSFIWSSTHQIHVYIFQRATRGPLSFHQCTHDRVHVQKRDFSWLHRGRWVWPNSLLIRRNYSSTHVLQGLRRWSCMKLLGQIWYAWHFDSFIYAPTMKNDFYIYI